MQMREHVVRSELSLPQTRRARIAVLIAASTAALLPASAWAQSAAPEHASEAVFVAEVALLLLVGRTLGELMQRLGQTALIGQLLAGVLLGPSVFGLFWPQAQHLVFPPSPAQRAMIDGLAQFGVLLLLLLTGMETDLPLIRRTGRAAFSIAISGVVIPFLCGFVLGELLPEFMLPMPGQRLVTSLFLGTALSISSVKIVGIVVREMNFLRRNLGQIIVASAIIEDTIGWVIVAVTFGVASRGTIEAAKVVPVLIGTVLFLAVCLTVGRRVVYALIRWSNDSFESEFPVITMILLIMAASALITDAIGVHTVLGAFVAGILIGESPILTRHIKEQLSGLVSALFMPVFFGVAGLNTDLTVLRVPVVALLTCGFVVIASVGKFGGAFLGGLLGRLSARESLALGCAMNARGSTEVIVASIGLSMAALSETLFSMIVVMAIVTTVTMPPALRWALARVPLSENERQRLEREELDSRGFVPNLERLLLAADHSANGELAARLAGLLAGRTGIPTTVVNVASSKRAADDGAADPDMSRHVKAAAAVSKRHDGEEGEDPDVSTRAGGAAPEQAVANEARKGYDLLIIGMDASGVPRGELPDSVVATASGFEGPVAVVVRADALHALTAPGILVPVNGTEPSRRAAELALAIARPVNASLEALYVSSAAARRSLAKKARRMAEAEAILRDVAELAERYEVESRSAIKIDDAPEKAILNEVHRRGLDLIVIGVAHRTGSAQLLLGHTATSLLEHADTAIILVLS